MDPVGDAPGLIPCEYFRHARLAQRMLLQHLGDEPADFVRPLAVFVCGKPDSARWVEPFIKNAAQSRQRSVQDPAQAFGLG